MRPKDIQELLKRADFITGMTVKELAEKLGAPIPSSPLYAKGFIGQIVEVALGADAGSHPMQDFPELDIELKTIPINYSGLPKETTHVCLLHQKIGQTFENSNFWNKIKRVLWVPVEGNVDVPLQNRHIGQGFLWEIDEKQKENLKSDWQEIMDALSEGNKPSEISRLGKFMQIRPSGKQGNEKIYSYYLRKNFTQDILKRHLQGEQC